MSGTLDIQDLVDYTRSVAVKTTSAATIANLHLALPFTAQPWIKWIIDWLVPYYYGKLWDKGERRAFNLNADLLTGSQGRAYRDAVAKILLSPDDISDEEWIKLEEKANEEFLNLVSYRR